MRERGDVGNKWSALSTPFGPHATRGVSTRLPVFCADDCQNSSASQAGYVGCCARRRNRPAVFEPDRDDDNYAAHAKAANTLKAYRTDWAHFSAWCALHRLACLPAAPNTVALYLRDLASAHRVSTLYRRLSGISQARQAAGLLTPTRDPQVRLVFQGIRRTLGSAPTQKNAAGQLDPSTIRNAQ
jgi:hypothetical protein